MDSPNRTTNGRAIGKMTVQVGTLIATGITFIATIIPLCFAVVGYLSSIDDRLDSIEQRIATEDQNRFTYSDAVRQNDQINRTFTQLERQLNQAGIQVEIDPPDIPMR